jgi:hypothetical protein
MRLIGHGPDVTQDSATLTTIAVTAKKYPDELCTLPNGQ